jgi:hypothetical protein
VATATVATATVATATVATATANDIERPPTEPAETPAETVTITATSAADQETDGVSSRGIGLDMPSWEDVYGKPTREDTLGLIYKDGAFIVIPHGNNNIWHLERNWDEKEAVPFEDAKKLAQGFIPTDSTFIKGYELNISTRVEVFHSDWLATRYPEQMDWTGGSPGDFIITYTINDQEQTISFIITTGNNP